jgi:N-acetylneuraminic acid mutarotase
MKLLPSALVCCGLLSAATVWRADAASILAYQGRVVVGGSSFQGTGQFKFALVDHNGVVTFWSNDGSSSGGSQPTSAVPVLVSQGLYSALLGDTNMVPLAATVFTNADVRLRVWFSDGVSSFQQLAPDQRIAAVGYAMMSPTVADGGITASMIAAGAVAKLQLANNSVTTTKLAPGSITFSNFASGSFVPSDGAILSSNRTDPALLKAGYIRIRNLQSGGGGEVWQPRSSLGAPAARHSHTAVWTGTEMIVWGGTSGSASIAYYNDGARFNPLLNRWTSISKSNAPSPRTFHTAVWTGTEMIVWGGSDGNNELGDGAAYNPATDTWRTLSAAGAPLAREQHVAVWTGSQMVVWGGFTKGAGLLGSGGRYDPKNNSWTGMDTNTFGGRIYEPVVWSGTYVMVWAGSNGSSYQNIALLYELATDRWYFQLDGAPSGRWYPSAVWTGTEMIVWGGSNGSGTLNDGGRFNPAVTGGNWISVTTTGAPAKRNAHTAVWTGSEMIVWGGGSGNSYLSDGGRYKPAKDFWTPMTTVGAPPGRIFHTAVWTGSEMIVFGGSNPGDLGDTYSYQPSQVIYLYVKQ